MSPFRASAAFTSDWKHFDFALSDGVATVTFTRPERLNALTLEVYADLRDLLTELPHREDVRVLVLTGTGRGFCSGGDVDEIIGVLLERDTHETMEFTRMTGAVVKAMRECPRPIVASVNGIAAGAGAVIALAADLRILARSAAFAFLFTKVGLAGADMGSAYLLPRLVGLGRATELLSENLSGRIRLSELAAECDLSISHFARSFKASFGVSAHRWLVQRRIERAQELLIETYDSLADIADQAGFSDQAAFTRTFHQIVGVSPGRWRRDYQPRESGVGLA